MATSLAGLQFSTAGYVPKAIAHKELFQRAQMVSFPLKSSHTAGRVLHFQTASGPSTPSDLSSKVSESIGKAQETCADDPQSGECVAAWDEVEELSAAASHARDRMKDSDPLEDYCKDNPEADECRTYED